MTSPKRPYQRPVLEPAEIFGAEVLATTCCKSGGCATATKTAQSKAKPSTNS